MLRKLRGYSQEAFAHECDIHRTYMGDVERGERNIALNNIVRIAYALGLTLDELFRDLETPVPQDMARNGDDPANSGK